MRHSVVVLDSTAAVDAVDARVDALDSGDVSNASAVTGADVTAALNAVKTALGLCLDNVAIQVFTASGTYTPAAGMKKCLVIITGGGGGSGSADTDGSDSTVALSGAGAGGATCIKLFTAAEIGASKAVTIGAGGNAGANGGDGTSGGTSTFGSGPALLTATGGTYGLGSGANVTAQIAQSSGSFGGSATGGDINLPGGNSRAGFAVASASAIFGCSGDGGGSFWGQGGPGRYKAQSSLSADNSQSGSSGTTYGCGAAGAINITTATATAGTAGNAGICVVLEFIESAF